MDKSEWDFKLRKNLVHPDAIKCVVLDNVVDTWWQAGFTPVRVARELNKRYQAGYLERKSSPITN